MARGVITIIPKSIAFVLENVEHDSLGRYIIVTGMFSGKKLTIVNFYAPTQDKPDQQVKIFDEICNRINGKEHETIW
jgi:hypothetical protein